MMGDKRRSRRQRGGGSIAKPASFGTKGFGAERRMGVRFAVRFAALAVALTTEHRSGNLLDWRGIGASAYEICGGNGVGVDDAGSWEGNGNGNGNGNGDGNANGNDSHGGNEFICPTGNTCCRMAAASSDSGEDAVSWGCIASDMGARTATCCNDNDGARNTGCPSGYECRRRENEEGGGAPMHDCFLAGSDSVVGKDNPPPPPPGRDPLLEVLPRYRLCRAEANNRRLHGLPVHPERFSETAGASPNTATTVAAELAYYSNLGPVNDPDNPALSGVEMALIVVHGANRNGDDYFCSAKATIDLQDRFGKNSIDSRADADGDGDVAATSVLVVAPDFRSSPASERFLYWDEANDRDGSWRYGADASGPGSGAISSFDAVDALVSTLRSAALFPGLRRIAVVGHSSGGQFVQRWSLSTPPEVWPPPRLRLGGDPIAQRSGSGSGSIAIAIHAVVANPSNYVYFTPLRFLADEDDSGSASGTGSGNHRNDKGLRGGNRESAQGPSSSSSWSWRLPSNETRKDYEDCPGYNRWEYGLEDGGPMSVPYWRRAVARDSKARIAHRYLAERSVSYLIGDLDRCDDGTDRRCQSHGLETTCADELQGRNRYERNARYLASLELELELDPEPDRHVRNHHDHHDRRDANGTLRREEDATGKTGAATNHRRIVVPDVGHDHSMMFQSEQGIHAIYYAFGTTGAVRTTIEERSFSEVGLAHPE